MTATDQSTIETLAGPMTIETYYQQEHPDKYGESRAEFYVIYRFGNYWERRTFASDPTPEPGRVDPITINRLEYHGDITVKFYRGHQSEEFNGTSFPSFNLRRTDGGAPTDTARSKIADAIHQDYTTRNFLPLITAAQQTHAQNKADRLINKAREELARAQEWAKYMAPGDARHYAQGFTVTAKHTDAEDVAEGVA